MPWSRDQVHRRLVYADVLRVAGLWTPVHAVVAEIWRGGAGVRPAFWRFGYLRRFFRDRDTYLLALRTAIEIGLGWAGLKC
jgi:hypothetical protein